MDKPPSFDAGEAPRRSTSSLGENVGRQRYNWQMPELSRFLGIVIAMYYRDHGPADFHAIYGDFEATVNIVTGQLNGELPKRALAHVQEWRLLHQSELLRLGRSPRLRSHSQR